MNLVLDFNESSFRKKCDSLMRQIFSYTLKEYPETKDLLRFYNSLSLERVTNQHILTELSWVVYSSGFRYDIVKKYWPAITEAFQSFEVAKVAHLIEEIEAIVGSGTTDITCSCWVAVSKV